MSGYFGIAMLLSLSAYSKRVHSHLTTVPRDTESGINQTTYLNCSTSYKGTNVAWYHYRVGEPYTRNDVFEGGSIHRNYRDRFSIKEDDRVKGIFNLVIDNVQVEDAGKYECQDEEGIGMKSSAKLIVLEDSPKCQSNANENGFVGPNSCGIEPEMVQLSCDVRYHGDSPPELEWVIDEGGNSTQIVPSKLCKSSGSRITCNATRKADLQMNVYKFTCRSSRSTVFSSNQCIYEAFDVVYAFNSNQTIEMKMGDEANCTAKSNQQCSYRWKFVDGNQELTMPGSSMLKIDRAGWFRCEAQCVLGSNVCTVVPMVVHVPTTTQSGSESTFSEAVFILLLTLVAVLVISMFVSILIFCFRLRKERKRNRKRQRENTTSNKEFTGKPIESNGEEKPWLTQENLKRELEKSEQANEKLTRARNDLQLEKGEIERKSKNEIDALNGTIAHLEQQRQSEKNWKKEEESLRGLISDLERSLYQARPGNIQYRKPPALLCTMMPGKEAPQMRMKNIRGLALLDGELFVLFAGSSEAHIHDPLKGSLIRKWKLDDLKNPWDLGCCRRLKCLFILDWKRGADMEIFRVDPNGIIINRWSTGDNGGCLSVTADSNILVSVIKKNLILEYSPEGQLSSEMILAASEGLAHPLHALKLSTGHYLVSHGQLDSELHRVCVMNDRGKVIKSFGGKKGSDLLSINTPIYLALSQDGSIFVSDYRNRRVLLLSRKLNYKEELPIIEGLRFCERICFDEFNGLLIIANNDYDKENKRVAKDGQILIYSMTKVPKRNSISRKSEQEHTKIPSVLHFEDDQV